ncbi:MAG: helicase-exonuclease AddAB subunit AddA [Lachnospiraceae bacterium]|nr:helicase-exonuclease AddAB subunit AddA [Lachnospiraceae bacterium]
MGYTKEQLQAIESRNENLLVSAAAGSGKTTVLVERIIRRVIDSDSPVDIDRMLVMTFTKAAADQMREKILKAINKERAEDPSNKHLMRQSTLVHNAQISTIHGFCLTVIRNHFQEIGLDPGFRVADEGECKLLKQDVLTKVLEAEYEEGSDSFINMTECLAAGKSDAAVADIIDKLYEFAMSYPEPKLWLKKCEEVYTAPDHTASEYNTGTDGWIMELIHDAKCIIADALKEAGRAYELCNRADGPYMYASAVEKDIELLEDMMTGSSYDEMRSLLLREPFPKLGRAKKEGPYVDPDLQNRVKRLRDGYKKAVSNLASGEFRLTLEENCAVIKACAPVAGELIRLTCEFIDQYALAKRDRLIVDFTDLEHMCIDILSADDGSTAKEYREYFEEIYVDEYQDSNLVQEELLKYISRGNNIFMVGDVKQSIYSFRLARPQLFTKKYKEYANKTESCNRRIDLSTNFRSRASVLTSVNELFVQIMSRELGGIDYDEAATLYPGAEYPETAKKQEVTELMLIAEEDGIDKRELEAKAIAHRIKELMREQMVFDGEMRHIRYSDIVILLRSARGWDEKFKKVIAAEGIPVHVMSQTGYFAAMEVSVLLDYLAVLDNPLQDIKLAAALHSVFGGFTDEDMAVLRTEYPGKYLFDSLKLAAGRADTVCEYQDETEEASKIISVEHTRKVENNLCKKAAEFLDRYNEIRGRVRYTCVYELLLEIIEGGYGTYVSALPDGKRKRANLNMLLKKADDYGKMSYKGLFHFIRYIETLRKYDVDFGEANTLDENDDTVRIMTIHKSKGLEFPVCFVAGVHKKYNTMDSRDTIIPDIDLGIGMEYVDPKLRIRRMTGIRNAAAKKKLFETLAEEERVLYVAMTRAKEKLIMTGVVRDFEDALRTDTAVSRCYSYLDLILHGLNNAGLPSVMLNTVSAADMVDAEIKKAVDLNAVKLELFSRLDGKCEDDKDTSYAGLRGRDEYTDMLLDRFNFIYPYENEKKQFEKVSVTELKRRSMHEDIEDKEVPEQGMELCEKELSAMVKDTGGKEIKPYIPDFIREQDREIPAALHGTAVHRVFEIWDYNKGTSDEDIYAFLDHVRKEGLMEDELADCVKLREISGFVNSELAARMKRAYEGGLLYREQPFMFSFDGLLIQGIIDAYFIEDGKIVIVDYKTDRVDDADELKERYHVQLEYYARALTEMTGREIGELIIYSTRHNCTVNIPWNVH